jgi:hypothetical protein
LARRKGKQFFGKAKGASLFWRTILDIHRPEGTHNYCNARQRKAISEICGWALIPMLVAHKTRGGFFDFGRIPMLIPVVVKMTPNGKPDHFTI